MIYCISYPIPSQLEGACVPAPDFLRVRELVEGRPTKIFKQSGHSLRYVYVNETMLVSSL
jgi:hypothetical protein